MNKAEFIKQLRATAEVLKPLTLDISPNTACWDGERYVKGMRTIVPNAYAMAWWSKLGAIAELIEAQESDLSRKQIDYLKCTLFGGMGSLNDLSFESESKINKQLSERREILFASFKSEKN